MFKTKSNKPQPNHLLGNKQTLIQLTFHNVTDLLAARRIIAPLVEKNKSKKEIKDTYEEIALSSINVDFDDLNNDKKLVQDPSELIYEIREYDVPYHVRVAIDKDIRVGKWYTVESKAGIIQLTEMPEREIRADPVVLAFDIETTKLPLKFPDAAIDKVMMISYMIDGEGFLITNREIVSEDIDDFEYTPKPEYPGVFTIFNEPDEKALLERFFEHVQEAKPSVIATFNGDFFDWPFVEKRAAVHGIDMYTEIGFKKDSEEEYKSTQCVHMDCFRWVKRDSYLPQGSQGLKAVTTAKLGYNPIEIDPELMTPYAMEKPQTMAEYSVSDAVATYYLYMKYVHPFIFSLCNIIPLNPDEVLRKGTGTLCEMLLMVQAYKGSIVLPNKHTDPLERFYKGHLLETETYVGGHVESLEAGVFRSDIPAEFEVDSTAVDELLRDLDNALVFSIEVEASKKLEDVTNYDEVKQKITEALMVLKNEPKRNEKPSIYHVDVASMYPNIMTTNRLQPDSMITEEDCAACDFNRPGKNCDRRLPWAWRGEFFPAKLEEYMMIRRALENEVFPAKSPNFPPIPFSSLSASEQASHTKKRLTEYSRKVYHRVHKTETIEREAIICQRENPFYVNTVRDFRDRRYHFKTLQKVWKKKASEVPANDAAGKEDAKKMIVLYDSLQLAHKVILNSFYGYVMRKGSRWYSMEMAGVTCLTGATIIQLARKLVERLGRPLELDTDGIWCILPGSFPENFTFDLKDGKKIFISYPCVMLNHLVHAKFTNHQYQTLVDPKTHSYSTMSDNSIFFEVDGPYKAMVLPTSKEEGKGLKKRYAVFNDDGSLAELKGFELKRRGELKLIKTFQSQIFKEFLHGTTLKECYGAVARVADSWLDILESKGATLDREELLELISENKSMSKSLEEYGSQKSTSITTAGRLAEFLGASMVKDRGLNCKYIIADRPAGAPVTERAIPVAIFSSERSVKSHFLRKWLKDSSLEEFDPRSIIDWGYYWERLASTIQKIITIPAGLQNVENPVPRVPHPEWLEKRVRQQTQNFKQKSLSSYFTKTKGPAPFSNGNSSESQIGDIEDVGNGLSKTSAVISAHPKVAKVTRVSKRRNDASKAAQPAEEFEKLPDKVPPIDGEYSDWLSYQKKLWKIQKAERLRRRQVFGTSGSAVSSIRATGIASMMQNQVQQAFGHDVWNIVQILNNPSKPGEVRVTVSIGGKLQTVRVKVPRKIYVNFKTGFIVSDLEKELSNSKIEKVPNIVLPDGSTSTLLYRLTMTEEAYLDEMDKPTSILKHPLVEGIYESNIDSTQNMVLDIGLACSLSNNRPGLLGKGLASGFELEWLSPYDGKSSIHGKAKHNYLDSVSFSYIHIIHVSFLDHHIVLIIPTWSSKAHILIARPISQAQPFPNLARIYTSLLAERNARIQQQGDDTQNLFEYPNFMAFEETTFNSLTRLFQRANKILEALQSEKGIQTIVALQSPTSERFKGMVRTINDFPICQIRATNTSSFPSLGWQQIAAKKMIAQFFGLNKWLVHLHGLAKYSKIPLCNLQWDDMRYVIDVNYARRLRAAGLVLWWSSTPLPDEGGKENDAMALSEIDALDLPVVNNPGLYTTVCLDLSVRNLVIDTVLTASLLMNAEGGGGSSGNSILMTTEYENGQVEEKVVPFVEGAFSTPAIIALSSMVKGWWNQALKEDESSPLAIFSDAMVNSFLSWVSSRDSFMYHRTLLQHVNTLTQKTFIQLLREVRKSGSRLVFADQSHLVLLTSKSSVETSYAYANYLIKTIHSKPFFQFLDLEINCYWGRLLWMDDVNFGGLGCVDIDATSSNEVPLELALKWDIKGFLPPKLALEFDSWITKFLEAVDEKVSHYDPHATADSDSDNEKAVRATQIPHSNEDTANMLKGTVQGLQKQFLSRVRALIQKQHLCMKVNIEEAIAEENEEDIASYKSFNTVSHPGSLAQAFTLATNTLGIPIMSGSGVSTNGYGNQVSSMGSSYIHNQNITNNNVLQLVKFICAIFSLAKSIELEVRLFRRNALSLFDIREFSTEGNFSNPTASLRVSNFSCSNCGDVRDVDLCRGVSERIQYAYKLWQRAQKQQQENNINPLDDTSFGKSMSLGECTECGHPYSRVQIEEQLIQQVLRLLTQYQVQDLKCSRCKRVREDDMSLHCPCSGDWIESLPRDEVARKIAIYAHSSGFYGLKLLSGFIENLF